MSCQKKQINDEFWVICSVNQTVKSSCVYNLDFQFFFQHEGNNTSKSHHKYVQWNLVIKRSDISNPLITR